MKKENGITLIALVVTIVVLIILAGVSISMLTGENGIINQASKAKEENEISTEKEMVNLSYSACRTKNNYEGIVTSDEMQKELDNIAGTGKTTVEPDGNNLLIEFNTSGRVYIINQNGEISESEKLEKVDDDTPGQLDGDGTQNNPYKISSIEDLVAFKYIVANGDKFENKYVILDTDLSFTSNSSYVDPTRTDMGDVNGDGVTEELKKELTSGLGFGSIGMYNNNEFAAYNPQEFSGNFDGKNHKLKNYMINNTTENYSISGLFVENTGTIKDFIIENANLTNVNNSFDGTTLLCIYNDGVIENCKITGEIELKNVVEFSGICIENNGTISKCENQSNIYNEVNNMDTYIHVAGICMTNNANILLSSNSGNIVAKNQQTESNIQTRAREAYITYVIGISDNNHGTINGCYNKGKLEATGIEGFEIAGITNISYDGTIYNCYNTGNFKGISIEKDSPYQAFSGIAIDSGIISNCYNIGKFETEDGKFDYVVIEGNTDYGDVTNYYYLENILKQQYNSITEMTEQEMKSDDFVNTLNTNAEQLEGGIKFIKDDGQNGGYPIIEK